VKPGNAERLRLLALLVRYVFEPKRIDPPIGVIEIAAVPGGAQIGAFSA
jgi:hypothetical protein